MTETSRSQPETESHPPASRPTRTQNMAPLLSKISHPAAEGRGRKGVSIPHPTHGFVHCMGNPAGHDCRQWLPLPLLLCMIVSVETEGWGSCLTRKQPFHHCKSSHTPGILRRGRRPFLVLCMSSSVGREAAATCDRILPGHPCDGPPSRTRREMRVMGRVDLI